MLNQYCAFIEIDMKANPNPLLPGYTDKAGEEEGETTPWTWQAWVDQPHKAATVRDGGKTYIGAGTFSARSLCLTEDEHTALTEAGVTLIHPNSLPPEEAGE